MYEMIADSFEAMRSREMLQHRSQILNVEVNRKERVGNVM
jgi:hypothetical protein